MNSSIGIILITFSGCAAYSAVSACHLVACIKPSACHNHSAPFGDFMLIAGNSLNLPDLQIKILKSQSI